MPFCSIKVAASKKMSRWAQKPVQNISIENMLVPLLQKRVYHRETILFINNHYWMKSLSTLIGLGS